MKKPMIIILSTLGATAAVGSTAGATYGIMNSNQTKTLGDINKQNENKLNDLENQLNNKEQELQEKKDRLEEIKFVKNKFDTWVKGILDTPNYINYDIDYRDGRCLITGITTSSVTSKLRIERRNLQVPYIRPNVNDISTTEPNFIGIYNNDKYWVALDKTSFQSYVNSFQKNMKKQGNPPAWASGWDWYPDSSCYRFPQTLIASLPIVVWIDNSKPIA